MRTRVASGDTPAGKGLRTPETPDEYHDSMTFRSLRLSEPIVRAVALEGYETPTPIQQEAIPAILNGDDVLGCARTGAGKTGAFAMPILHRLAPARQERLLKGRRPRALVLCPTRELAAQILESFNTYRGKLPLRAAAIFGGVNQFHQVKALKNGLDVVVATPGRLLDLMNQRLVDLRDIETLVLDEADHMLDLGFIRDIRKIIDRLPADRQTLLFSATMPPDIRRLADDVLVEPTVLETSVSASPPTTIRQTVCFVDRAQKLDLLERVLCTDGQGRTLVFSRTKHGADKLVKRLDRAGIPARAIHGNKTQGARTRALDAFKSGRVRILVATDIAARGIDVDDITHVVNFDLPSTPETYVHRIGRTARAGASGVAVSFCEREQLGDLRSIERTVGDRLTIDREHEELLFEPREQNRGGGGGGGGRPDRSKSNRSNSNRSSSNRSRQGRKPRARKADGGSRRNAAPSKRSGRAGRPARSRAQSTG